MPSQPCGTAGRPVAVAAKPMITGADIEDGSVTSADVQNDSLTGSDILESSLGTAAAADTATSANQATNANSRGGVAASGYMRGEGTVVRHFEEHPAGTQTRHYGIAGWFSVSQGCNSNPPGTDFLLIANRADQKITVFEDDGGANPLYHELDPTGTGAFFFISDTAAAGDLTILTVRHPDGRVATAFVSTLAHTSDCMFQLQITVTNSEAADT